MLTFPLETISLTKSILGQAANAMQITQTVGVGIASIFILFVVFHDISSLLDGGKFQIRMLWPLLIYLAVCNFNLVASPVISFTSSIQEACVSSAGSYRNRIIAEMSGGKVSDGRAPLWDAFQYQKQLEYDEKNVDVEDVLKELEDPEIVTSTDEDGNEGTKLNGFFSSFSSFFDNLWLKIKNWFWSLLAPIRNTDFALEAKWGALGAVAMVFSWVCEFVGLAVKCLGAVMTGLIIAFGPITWAFAVFPGNSKVLGAWFIRLCQFALYAPLVGLIEAFSITCLFMLGSASEPQGVTMLMGVILCQVVALTSIPSIASMIIEGASGAVSLSQGLQTAASAVGAAGSIVSSPFRGGYNIVKAGQEWKMRTSAIGEDKRDKDMQSTLEDIANSVRGGGPSGQNSQKGGGSQP